MISVKSDETVELDDDEPPPSKTEQQSKILSEDFILNGFDYSSVSSQSKHPFLHFLATQFPSLFGELFISFGIAPILALSVSYFCVKGMAFTAFQLVVLPFIKDGLNVEDGATYQRITTITSLAWPMVTVMGLLSDGCPIFGYRKRYYLTGAAVLGTSLLCGIFFLKPSSSTSSSSPISPNATPVWLAAFFMFVINFCFATIDLLCEAAYSRLYVLRPKAGAAVISLVWGLVMISGVPGAFVVGPLADAHKSFLAMTVIGLLVSVTIVPFYLNWLGEKPITSFDLEEEDLIAERESSPPSSSSPATTMMVVEKDLKIHEKVIMENENHSRDCHHPQDGFSGADATNLRFQGIAMGVICPLTACAALALEMMYDTPDSIASSMSLQQQKETNREKALRKLAVPVLCACLLLYLAFRFLPSKIFKALTFMMLKEVLYVNLAGAEDFFFVADAQCVPNGPQFSYTYYQTMTTAVGSIFAAVGSVLFHKYFAKENFQKLFYMTTSLRVAASLFDIALIERWNIKYLHISDRAAYMFGDAMIYPVTATLDLMPAVMLMAQLCPHGHEATMNAVLAGFTNYGQGISGFLGAYLTDVFGIRTKTYGNSTFPICDFTNLSWLVLLGHGIMPAMTLLLISVLVPDSKADYQQEQNEMMEKMRKEEESGSE